jgi:hypothetical protein
MSYGRRTIALDEATYEALIAISLHDPRPLREIVREIIRAHVARTQAAKDEDHHTSRGAP